MKRHSPTATASSPRSTSEAPLYNPKRFFIAKLLRSETSYPTALHLREAPAKRPFEPFVPFEPFALTITSNSQTIHRREAPLRTTGAPPVIHCREAPSANLLRSIALWIRHAAPKRFPGIHALPCDSLLHGTAALWTPRRTRFGTCLVPRLDSRF